MRGLVAKVFIAENWEGGGGWHSTVYFVRNVKIGISLTNFNFFLRFNIFFPFVFFFLVKFMFLNFQFGFLLTFLSLIFKSFSFLKDLKSCKVLFLSSSVLTFFSNSCLVTLLSLANVLMSNS